MLFGFLFGSFGRMKIGMGDLTEPTSSSYSEEARIGSLDPVYGKEVDQDHGDKRATRALSFFFDEAFCNVEGEVAKLTGARRSRSPIKLDYGRSYDGKSYIITSLTVTEHTLDSARRVVRAEVTLNLRESSGGALLGAAISIVAPLIMRG